MIANIHDYYEKLSQLPPELQQIVLTPRVMCGLANEEDIRWFNEVGGFRHDLIESDAAKEKEASSSPY